MPHKTRNNSPRGIPSQCIQDDSSVSIAIQENNPLSHMSGEYFMSSRTNRVMVRLTSTVVKLLTPEPPEPVKSIVGTLPASHGSNWPDSGPKDQRQPSGPLGPADLPAEDTGAAIRVGAMGGRGKPQIAPAEFHRPRSCVRPRHC